MTAPNLEFYRKAIGQTVTGFAQAVTKASGVEISTDLIREAERYEKDESKRFPMALPKAQAIAQFLTQEMGRPISISDLDLKVI